jgi:translation elongation factor EF-Tu-like GTPase
MKEFKSEDTFKYPSGQTIKVVRIPNPDRVTKPEGLPEIREIVTIDGELYTVLGVEMFMKLMSPPFRGENVGLRVKPLAEELKKKHQDHVETWQCQFCGNPSGVCTCKI